MVKGVIARAYCQAPAVAATRGLYSSPPHHLLASPNTPLDKPIGNTTVLPTPPPARGRQPPYPSSTAAPRFHGQANPR